MPGGRPKSAISRVRITVRILKKHDDLLNLLDKDTFFKNRAYGARNTHLDLALEAYFQQHYPELLARANESE